MTPSSGTCPDGDHVPDGRRSGRIRAARGGRLLIAAAAIVALASCGSGERTLGVVDPLAAPLAPTFEQAKRILDRKCLPCHDGGGEAEGGEDADYSTCQGIVAGVGGILDTAVDGNSMPPGALPRLTEREKLLLRRWIDQGACAPCNPCP